MHSIYVSKYLEGQNTSVILISDIYLLSVLVDVYMRSGTERGGLINQGVRTNPSKLYIGAVSMRWSCY